MKKSKNIWSLPACIISCVAVFAACDIAGMGETVDLTAPALTLEELVKENGESVDLTAASGAIYVGAVFTIKGRAQDDKTLDRIVVEELLSDGSVRPDESRSALGEENLKPVLLSNTQTALWETSIALQEEGERTFRFILYDKSQNSNPETSVKYITLVIDKTPPVVERVEIDRKGDVLFPLMGKEALQALDSGVYTNINMFQNESFTLKANLDEQYAVSSVVLTLYGDNDEPIIENMPKTGGSNFIAEWFIDHELITRNHSGYATGRHYLRVEITSRDVKGNENVDRFPYLCWYPESDIPHIEADNSSSETNITGPAGMAVSITAFDDDSLGAVYARMWTLAEWDAMNGADDKAKADAVKETAFSDNYIAGDKIGVLSKTSVLISGSESIMKLVVAARDKTATGGTLNAKVWTVSYTSNDRPVIVVESPSEGAVPQVDPNAGFTITGYTLDSVGADQLRIAWIPGDDASRIDEAVAALGTFPPPSLHNGIKLWDLAGGMASGQVIDGFKKKEFSKTFNLLSDFNNEGRKTKLFVFWTARADGTSGVTRTFRVGGNDERPLIAVLKPDDIHDSAKSDLTFRFTVTGGIGTLTKTIVEVDDDVVVDIASDSDILWDGGAWTYTIAKSALPAERAKYEIAVTDALGNANKTRKTVVFSSLPALSAITSTMPNNSAAKMGDSLLLTADFTQPVAVSGNPRLRFRFDGNVTAGINDSGWKYAAYQDGSGTSTLTFAYTVQRNDLSDKLHSSRVPIDCSTGTISALLPGVDSTPAWVDGSNSLESKKTLKIDGVPPMITGLAASGKSSGWYTIGETITLAMTVNDNVLVNGAPRLTLDGIAGGAAYANYAYPGSGVVYFTYTPAAGRSSAGVGVAGLDLNNGAITDYAGNPLEGVAAITGGVSPATGIDTQAPSAPVLKAANINGATVNAALVSGNYKSLVFKVEAPTDGGSPLAATYSINGGMNWADWTGSDVALPSGAYEVAARSADAAGNVSTVSNSVAVEVNGTFPTLAAVTCDKPHGSYPKGTALTFRLIFTGKVYSPTATAYITIKGKDVGDSSCSVSVVSVAKNAAANTLDFVYTVDATHTMSDIEVTAINLSGVLDLYDNTYSGVSDVTFPFATGRNVYGKIPAITKFEVMAPGGNWQDATQDGLKIIGSGGARKISLAYSTSVKGHSEVGRESGVITIRPATGWLIPPVVKQEEFESVSNYTALLDDASGYKKTTHGLRVANNDYVPDTATKYVLAFDKGLDDSTLRNQFDASKYRWQEIDVTEVSLNGAAVVVTLPKDLAPGVKWTVSISAGAFSDAAGNTTAALPADIYCFWSEGLSPPVARVDRTSHDKTSVAPALTARVRIDSETSGAVINYVVKEGDHDNSFSLWPPSPPSGGTSPSPANPYARNTDIAAAALQGESASTPYISFINVGSASDPYEARKDYIKAETTGSTANPALAGTAAGYEGVFRSVVMIREAQPDKQSKASPAFRAVAMMGSDVEMSIPTIAGFPLMDQTPERKFMRQMYMVDIPSGYMWNDKTTNAGKRFAWVSWEIVSEWSMRTAGYALEGENVIAITDNGSNNGGPWYGNELQKGWYKCTYGNSTYIVVLEYWR
ncbi:MAG: hypothetical protein LBK73_06970 [Treponema sp.]|jgi:hypothetical protein|nr:hypothetical protein [Treponema sp.]